MQECNDPAAAQIEMNARKKAEDVIQKLKDASVTLALAESCTAGMISSLLARIPGASNYLWGCFVCYTQEAKVKMLDLDNDRLCEYGLVSRETACGMAQGALKKSDADYAASVTGLAGPGGDDRNPAGTVWIAAAAKGKDTQAQEYHFSGSRNEVRVQAADAVLELILKRLT
ncbi:MAG: CinA family protein [Treponema sp.]|nr:CinA family protein [Treponema sp.]